MSATAPFIKVCGLTRPDNALACARAGADIIGLVFFEKSPRHVTMEQAAAITRELPETTPAWGVFVNAEFGWIMERVKACGLSGVQLHGNESPELVSALADEGVIVIKALFASKPPGLDRAGRFPHARYVLAECGQGALPGGNAKTWDYALARDLTLPVVLAGGLDPAGVGHAVAVARPAGVDVSSGVEAAYGIKDIEKVNTFVKAVKRV